MAAETPSLYLCAVMPWDVAKHMGQNLRRIRTDLGLTQFAFAVRIGIDQSTLSLYESGSRLPRLPHLVERLESAGIDPRALFALEDPPAAVADPQVLRAVAALRRLPAEVREAIADLLERLQVIVPGEFSHETAQLLELVQGLDATQRAGVVAGLRQLVGHLTSHD